MSINWTLLICTNPWTCPPSLITLCWEVAELSEDRKFALQSLQYGLHNKVEDERGNPAETADTAKMLFIIGRLAALDLKKSQEGLTRYKKCMETFVVNQTDKREAALLDIPEESLQRAVTSFSQFLLLFYCSAKAHLIKHVAAAFFFSFLLLCHCL